MALSGTHSVHQNQLVLVGGLQGPSVAAEEPVFTWTHSNDSTSGSVSVEPFVVETTMTGAGGVGGRGRFQMTTNVALGGWSNALKARATYGASGSTSGLGSAFVAEMDLSAGTSSGTYAPVEVELNAPASASTGTQTSFIYMSTQGANVAVIDDNAKLFSLNGVTAGAGHIFQTSAVSGVDSTHALKIAVNGTDYFVPIHTSAGFA